MESLVITSENESDSCVVRKYPIVLIDPSPYCFFLFLDVF